MIFLPMNKRGLRKNQPYALDRLVESALGFLQQKEGAAQDAFTFLLAGTRLTKHPLQLLRPVSLSCCH